MFLMGGNFDGWTSSRNLMENIDGQHPRPPVLAVLLEIIERENFDALLAQCQIHQYFPFKKIVLNSVYQCME